MSDQLEFNKTPDEGGMVLRSKQMDLDAGWLGRCFGSGKNAPMNIAGTLVLLLLASGIAVLFFQSAIPASDYWKIIVPLLTLVMGYVFGKSSKE